MRRICILHHARINSTRTPRKLLADIDGRTLLSIGLEKIRRVQEATGVRGVLAVLSDETELIEAAKAHDLAIFLRYKTLQPKETYTESTEGWAERLKADWDYVLNPNILCRPFLKVSSIRKLVDFAKTTEKPFVTVRRMRGILFNEKQECILGRGELADTRGNPYYYDLAHMGYGIPVDILESELAVSEQQVLFPMELDEAEQLDIDYPHQLEFARTLAKVMDPMRD